MARITRFINRQAVKARLARVPEQIYARAHAASEANRRELEAAIENVAPVDQGDLKISVKSRDNTSKSRISAVVTAGEGGQEAKARAQEFGRPDMEAQPFFFPTFRALRKRFRNRMSRAIAKGARETVTKL